MVLSFHHPIFPEVSRLFPNHFFTHLGIQFFERVQWTHSLPLGLLRATPKFFEFHISIWSRIGISISVNCSKIVDERRVLVRLALEQIGFRRIPNFLRRYVSSKNVTHFFEIRPSNSLEAFEFPLCNPKFFEANNFKN